MSLLRKKKTIEKSSEPRDIKTLDSFDSHTILVRPVVTEKTSSIQGMRQYVFEVARNANKVSIARSVAAVYGVRPEKVATMIVRGKKVRFGAREGKRNSWKKAIITLPKGSVIDTFHTK